MTGGPVTRTETAAESRLTSIRAATMMIRDDATTLYAFADAMRNAIGEATLVKTGEEVRLSAADWARIEQAALQFALLVRRPPLSDPPGEAA